MFWKIPICIIAPKFYWHLIIWFLVHFMLIYTKNIRFYVLHIRLNLIKIYSGSDSIYVPWRYHKLFGCLTCPICPPMDTCLNLGFLLFFKMFRIINFKMFTYVFAGPLFWFLNKISLLNFRFLLVYLFFILWRLKIFYLLLLQPFLFFLYFI
jgi:hypothetical protein